MNHYFTDNTEMHHNRKELSFRFCGVLYTFISDAGVFSKDSVDYGTSVLIDTCYKNQIKGKTLDLGCGYGPIAIILQKALGLEMVAVDVNSRAVELTSENAVRNKANVRTLVSDGINLNETFDTIVTNPPIRAGKEVVYRFFTEAYDHLTINGELWVVIRKQQGAESAIKKLKEIFNNCEIVEKSKGYFILKCQKKIDLLTNN